MRPIGANLADVESRDVHTASFARKGVALWGPVALTLTLVAGVTLVPASPPTRGDATPFWCLGCGDYALADAVANVVLFLPVGWALARTRMRWLSSLALVLGTTIGIESLQHGFVPGRVASLSDILTNTAGGVAGMALPALRRWIVESGRRALGASIGYGVLLVACLGVAAATEAVPRARMLHWTESADPSRYVRFSGSLSAVRVAGMPVPSHEWRSVPAREVVEVGVDFLSGRPDTGLARVLIGWMPNGSGWVWLEQRGRDLHVHIASASDHLRLHGHSEWLNGIMPAFAAGGACSPRLGRPRSLGPRC